MSHETAARANLECRDRNHLHCGGDAWKDEAGGLTVCDCFCHDGEDDVP